MPVVLEVLMQAFGNRIILKSIDLLMVEEFYKYFRLLKSLGNFFSRPGRPSKEKVIYTPFYCILNSKQFFCDSVSVSVYFGNNGITVCHTLSLPFIVGWFVDVVLFSWHCQDQSKPIAASSLHHQNHSFMLQNLSRSSSFWKMLWLTEKLMSTALRLCCYRPVKRFNTYALQDVDLFTAGVSEIPLPGRLLGN